jgi:hypothetical protein
MAYVKTVYVDNSAPDIDAANLNHSEQGIFDAAATADAALPTPGGTNGQFLKRVGGVWVPTSFAASDIPSFPSDVAKALLGDGSWAQIANAQVAAAAALAISKLADPGSAKVIGSLGAGAVAVFPPGTELAYAEVSTATTNITPTTEGTATTYLTAPSFTADGTAVWVEVSIPAMDTPALAGQNLYVVLFEGATAKGNLIRVASPSAAVTRVGMYQRRKLTPAAGATVYTAKTYVDSGTGVLRAGAGSTGVEVPAYIRVVKA